MNTLDNGYAKLTDLQLWVNVNNQTELSMSDIPELISLRWVYIRDNWETIKQALEDGMAAYTYPDILKTQIDALSKLIENQRTDTYQKINPFSDISVAFTYFHIWKNILIGSIPITKQENDIIQDKIRKVNAYSLSDFKIIKQALIDTRDEIADNIGLQDDTYNTIYSRSSVRQLKKPKIKDINNIQQWMIGINSIDYILANSALLPSINVDPFTLARNNANNPDIEIQSSNSINLVKMNFGDSLQTLAARYLGDADRWIEIAIANGLKPPYIDEIGEAIPLISNGVNLQINVAKQDMQGNLNVDKFYVGQPIFLQSNTVKFLNQRNIVSVREIPVSGELIIEVDGEANLDMYTKVDNAYIRVYKINTTNSIFLIGIPSGIPAPLTSSKQDEPFFISSKQQDEKLTKVDFALNEEQDLILTNSGDFQLSYGLANAVQSIKFKMLSEQGQNPRHPDYGLPNTMGFKSDAPDEIKDILVTGINDSISSDPRFDRVETIDVKVIQGKAFVNLSVKMAGSGTVVPISFSIKTG